MFLFKQMTAYEMRISDLSSDVCSSDLGVRRREAQKAEEGQAVVRPTVLVCRRVDPDRERHHPREDDGGERYDEREEQPLADDVRHGQVVLERVAEIAVQQSPCPEQILLVQRAVEPVMSPQEIDLALVDGFAAGLDRKSQR